jgi:hypothetical protein
VDTAEGRTCDPQALIRELDDRPQAKRAWAQVLAVPEEQVEDYILTLEPRVLESDTMVTNHGLHDDVAYARPSLLEAGTAALYDDDWPGLDLPPPTPATPGLPGDDLDTAPPTSSFPSTTGPPTSQFPSTTGPPAEGIPVTRCKCGNPLLPAYVDQAPERPYLQTSSTSTSLEQRPTTSQPQRSTTTTTEEETTTTESQPSTPPTEETTTSFDDFEVPPD